MSKATQHDRIKLVNTTDQYTSLSPGDTGTVTGVDTIPASVTESNLPERQVQVDWDDGSSLSLIESQDSYEVIESRSSPNGE